MATWPKAVILGLLVLIGLGAVGGVQSPAAEPGDTAATTPSPEVNVVYDQDRLDGADTPAGTANVANVDVERIERLLYRKLNAVRTERAAPNVTFAPELAAIAREHTRDMAARGFFDHRNPDGQELRDRIRNAGYDCSAEPGTQATGGAEVLAFTYYASELEGGRYHDSELDVAEGLVAQWLESTDHREVIENPEHRVVGIGVTVTTSEHGPKIIATVDFC